MGILAGDRLENFFFIFFFLDQCVVSCVCNDIWHVDEEKNLQVNYTRNSEIVA